MTDPLVEKAALAICKTCKGWLWVCCEDHPDQPWDDWHQKNCGPGGPCPVCNNEMPPRMMPDTIMIWTAADGYEN